MDKAITLIGGDGMIDKTKAEAEAIRRARKNLAEALAAHGLLEPFMHATPAAIDSIIEACVTGFQEYLKLEALNDEIPF